MLNKLAISKRSELRDWLLKHSQTEKECWVKLVVKPKTEMISYLNVVEEALCFGWIDSMKKKDDRGNAYQRLSPRRKGSNWTELNKERVRRLERLDLMTDQGRAVLPDMSESNFVIDEKILDRLKEDPEVYETFMSFPELYRRIRLDNIQGLKDEALYKHRLDKLIENTKNNIMYGAWHDDGRLLDLKK